MRTVSFVSRFCLILVTALSLVLVTSQAAAQSREQQEEQDFGPVVRAYLGYLRNEQEVVDDRVSRREISHAYYVRNTNRIRALREIAIRIARESRNDFLPELEAVARNEMRTLFEHPPTPEKLRVGEVLNDTFRFLGTVRSAEIFFVFARLDPYEQVELKEKRRRTAGTAPSAEPAPRRNQTTTRPRRVISP